MADTNLSADFIQWNVATVKKEGGEWTLLMVSREGEELATVRIRKMTLAELQENTLSGDDKRRGGPWTAHEGCAITVLNRDECYMTEVQTENVSKKAIDYLIANYNARATDQERAEFKAGLETSRALYEKLKTLPSVPLENGALVETMRPYFGLPVLVYMHLVGQMCTEI